MRWGSYLKAGLVLAVIAVPVDAMANANLLGVWQDRGGNAKHDGRGRIRATNLQYPMLQWRTSHESAGPGAAALGDLNADGSLEEIGLSGGSVVATDRNLEVLWTSDVLRAHRVYGVFQLGDSAAVIAGTADGEGNTAVSVLHPETGAVVFTAQGATGFDVVQVDGEEGNELLVRVGDTVTVHGFGSGLAAGELWSTQLLPADVNLTVGDVDADGVPEVVGTDDDGARVVVLQGESGEAWRRMEDTIRARRGCGPAQVVQTDADEQLEVLLTGMRTIDGDESVFIAVYDHVEDVVQWQYEYGQEQGSYALEMVPNAVVDLDGDGAAEVVVSVFNNTQETDLQGDESDLDGISNADAWTMIVYDGATGEVVDFREDARAVAVVHVEPNSRPVLVVRDAMRSLTEDHPDLGISGYLLGEDGLESLWELPRARPIFHGEESTAGCPGMPAALRADVDGDGAREIVVERFLDTDPHPDLLQRISLRYDSPRIAAEMPLTEVHDVAAVSAGDGMLDGAGHVALTLGDGNLTILDSVFGAQMHYPLGSYLASPRVLRLPADEDPMTADNLVMTRGPRGDLVMWDVAFGPAGQEFARMQVSAGQPWLSPLNADSRSVLTYVGVDEESVPFVRMASHELETLWERSFPNEVWTPRSMNLGDFTEEAHEDLAYLVGESAYIEVVDGADGSLLASRSVSDIGTLGDGVRLQTVPGPEGERDDLMIYGSAGAYYLDAEDLSTRGEISLGERVDKIVAVNVGLDLGFELFDNAGGPERSLIVPSTNRVVWTLSNGSDDDHSYFGVEPSYPGIVDVDGDSSNDIVIGGRFGDLTAYKGDTGDTLWRVCLSGGNVRAIATDVPPTRDLCDGALLSDVTTAELDGNSDNGEHVMVGSADGWVYAVVALSGAPLWSMPFHAPVGEVMAVNTDNDDPGELLINVSNGASFGLRDALPPTSVRDVQFEDGAQVDPEVDIDVTENPGALSFRWELDPDAERYEVGVIGDDGLLYAYMDVGLSPGATYLGQDLLPGQTYRGVVRAHSEARGYGHPAFSDGVSVVDLTPPEVSASADPLLFSPAQGGTTTIDSVATDTQGLRGLTFAASLNDAASVWTQSVAGRRATEMTETVVWDGLVDGEPAPDGAYDVTVTAVDFGDNEVSVSLTVELDSTPPPVPAITAPEENTSSVETTVTIAGLAQGDATSVDVIVDGAVICTAAPDADGNFSCDAEELTEGEHFASANASDALGNRSDDSPPLRFVVDTTPPVAPVITHPVDGVTIEDFTPAFEGTAEPEASVEIFLEDDTSVCIATSDAQGAFSCTGSEGFAPGEYTVYAIATDSFAVSLRSEDVTFTVAKPPANNGNNGNSGNNGGIGNNGVDGNNSANNGGVQPDNGADAVTADSGCGCQTPARSTASVWSWISRR